ncbi:MAG TPA: cytochrome c [Bryobacteraceae bacterium]|nr:cytochrome c [Bryobacteraceae bacterium]
MKKCLLLAAAAAGVICATPDKGSVERGKIVFDNSCADCHYPDSRDEKVGPGLQGVKDGKLPDGRPATHDKLLDILNTGPAEMPSFKDRISEQDKEDVIAYVLTL